MHYYMFEGLEEEFNTQTWRNYQRGHSSIAALNECSNERDADFKEKVEEREIKLNDLYLFPSN